MTIWSSICASRLRRKLWTSCKINIKIRRTGGIVFSIWGLNLLPNKLRKMKRNRRFRPRKWTRLWGHRNRPQWRRWLWQGRRFRQHRRIYLLSSWISRWPHQLLRIQLARWTAHMAHFSRKDTSYLLLARFTNMKIQRRIVSGTIWEQPRVFIGVHKRIWKWEDPTT